MTAGQDDHAGSSTSALNVTAPSLIKRTAFRLGGAFLLVGVLASVEIAANPTTTNSQQKADASKGKTAAELNTSSDATTPHTTSVNDDGITSSPAPSDTTGSATHTTTVSNNSTGDSVSNTQVTINGHSVSVPPNGSTTVTSSGPLRLEVDSSQTTTTGSSSTTTSTSSTTTSSSSTGSGGGLSVGGSGGIN